MATTVSYFVRLINNIRAEKSKKGSKLTPQYIIKKLDDILDYKNTNFRAEIIM